MDTWMQTQNKQNKNGLNFILKQQSVWTSNQLIVCYHRRISSEVLSDIIKLERLSINIVNENKQ